MATIDDADLMKRCLRKQAGMMGMRQGWEAHWSEVARFSQPRLGRIGSAASNQNSSAKQGQQLNNKLLNGIGIRSSETAANGMASGMCNPSTPWFKISTKDPDLVAYQPVKEWLAIVEDRLYGFFDDTNFYSAQKELYLEEVIFGTGCNFMDAHPVYGAVNYVMTAGQYWIALDDGLVADTMLRCFSMSVAQLYQKFAKVEGDEAKFSAQIRTAYDQGNYATEFDVWHMVEPNDAREYGKIDKTNKPYRSLYWEGTSGMVIPSGVAASDATYDAHPSKRFLEFSGYEERPFQAPRWNVTGTDTYGRSPAMTILPELRELQLSKLRKAQGHDYSIMPALSGPTSLMNANVSLMPRSVTTLANANKDQFGPIWQVDPRAIEMLREDIQEVEGIVKEGFYVPLFLAISTMPGVQPRTVEEVTKRNEEALAQLGPVVERNSNEQLRAAINRAFGILYRLGAFPPPPDQMHGQPLKIEFISAMVQLTRAIGVGSIERGMAFVGSLEAVFPEARDKVNIDEVIDEYFDRTGFPPKGVNSDEQVAAMRAQRAKQQAAATTAAAAPAGLDAAKAAELLSHTDAGNGGSLLARLTGGGSSPTPAL